MVEIGDAVEFVDQSGQRRPALVTAVWRRQKANPEVFQDGQWDDAKAKEAEAAGKPVSVIDQSFMPGVNVVLVSQDPKKDDPYGRQIERETSIPHQMNQVAHGFYWRRADDMTPLTPYQPQEVGPGVAH